MLWLLLLVVLAGAGWWGWQWWQQQVDARAEQATHEQRIASLEQRLEALRRDQRANGERLQQAEATNRLLREELLGLGQRAALLEDNIAELADAGVGGIQALRIDEAGLLLATAGQRLQVGDVGGAASAYALAAAVLERVDGPGIIDLRQALAQERAVVAALGPDPAIAVRARLAALEAATPELPQLAAPAVADDAPWWKRLAARVVDVRPTSGAPVAVPAERAAGRAAMQVELSLARAALERRDEVAFDAALTRIDGWLASLWPDSPQAREQRKSIQALRAAPLRLDAPELGSTLAQLRRLQDS